ncbi:MAG: sigma-70 family RNA polymerase sigma factor [Clostridia bacterium]|nr:sigma-70 family RNA polymerase sigma factor [Clostridia bacterium]
MSQKEKGVSGETVSPENALRLLRQRDERAVKMLEALYGKLIFSVAMRILSDRRDADEVKNDALFQLWTGEAPDGPGLLKARAAAIGRRRAIDILRKRESEKRCAFSLGTVDELAELMDGFEDRTVDSMVIRGTVSGFVKSLGERDRNIFLKRYYLFQKPEKIASSLGVSKNLVYVSLSRMRTKLKALLERELK